MNIHSVPGDGLMKCITDSQGVCRPVTSADKSSGKNSNGQVFRVRGAQSMLGWGGGCQGNW